MSSDEMTTQPTIMTVLERLNEMRTEINARFDALEQELKSIRADIRRLDRGFDKLAGEFARIRIVHDEIEERLDKMENQPA